MKKSICFAYYANGEFLGWYGDTFGSITETPKIYSSFEKMKDTITKNLSHKMKKINESSFEEAKNKADNIVSAIGLAVFQNEEDLRGKNVELRVIECPEYDGPNPNFDKLAYEKKVEDYQEKMKKEGIFDIPAPSQERLKAIDTFEALNPRPKCDNWIYADYSKVREWAKNEPTEFIAVIKPE